MRQSQYAGSFGGNVGTNVLNPSQGRDPFNEATPAPKPGYASRSGQTFTGGIAGALPRASNSDTTFGNVNLTGVGRDVFRRMGERAGNQDVAAYNQTATAANEAATAVKQQEIAAYTTERDQLLNQYNTDSSAFNDAWGAYDATLAGYNNNIANVNALNDRYDNYKYYDEIVNGPNVRNYDRQFYTPYYTQNRDLFNGYSAALKSNNPGLDDLFTGYFDAGTYAQPTVQLPEQPTYPDAPDPFVNLQQIQEQLPDATQRRLGPSQREVMGGALPPQVPNTTGDTFSQQEVPYRDVSQLNATEQQRLGAPKGYRVPQTYWTQFGQAGYGGGQTISPSDITNQSSTSYYIRNVGWFGKDQLTPLY